MNKKRRLKRRLEDLSGVRPHNPKKVNASRYEPSKKTRIDKDGVERPVRGAKRRGPKTICPHCKGEFFSKKQKSLHIQFEHRKPYVPNKPTPGVEGSE